MTGIKPTSDDLLSGLHGRFFYAALTMGLLLQTSFVLASDDEPCRQMMRLHNVQQELIEMMQLDENIKQLCVKGLKNKAQNQAYVIAEKIQNNPPLLALKLCALQHQTNALQQKIMLRYRMSKLRFKHVCDVQ